MTKKTYVIMAFQMVCYVSGAAWIALSYLSERH